MSRRNNRRGKYDKQQYREDPSRNSSGEELPPHVVTRFFLGCITQPLDSIEEYFGEKVAFYFTWLQHTASHWVFLSVPGLILFVLMLANHDFLHRLRPLFSIVVMIWTFIVLLNWKTPANPMAYRWGIMRQVDYSLSQVETVAEVQHFVSLDYLLHCRHVDPDFVGSREPRFAVGAVLGHECGRNV